MTKFYTLLEDSIQLPSQYMSSMLPMSYQNKYKLPILLPHIILYYWPGQPLSRREKQEEGTSDRTKIVIRKQEGGVSDRWKKRETEKKQVTYGERRKQETGNMRQMDQETGTNVR